MSELTWQILRDTDFAIIENAAAAWSTYIQTALEIEDDVLKDIDVLRDTNTDFEGTSADALRANVQGTVGDFIEGLGLYADPVTRILRAVQEDLTAKKQDLTDLFAEAGVELVAAGGIGEERFDIATQGPNDYHYTGGSDNAEQQNERFRLIERAEILTDEFLAIMADARDIDDMYAAALRALNDDAEPLPPRIGEADYTARTAEYYAEQYQEFLDRVESGEASPTETYELWSSLSSEDQAQLLTDRPELLGNTDGIPSQVRHDANMTILTDYVAAHPDDDDASGLLQQVDDENLMLLGFTPETMEVNGQEATHSDMQCIVATGDPDAADNIAIYIPGVGSDEDWTEAMAKAGTETYVDYAQNLTDAAESQDAAANNVTIMWLGYDAPGSFVEGYSQGYAEEGGEALDQFTTGISATNQANDANITQIGHSYGSTVTGYADQTGDTSDADQVVLIGSPGPGSEVDSAADFNVGGEDVYVSMSDNDPINAADNIVLGADTTDSELFPQRVDGGDGNHMEYFTDPDSLDNLGLIITDQGEQATRYDRS